MEDRIRDQKVALSRQLESLLPCREKRRITKFIQLSDAAKREPIRSRALQSLRNMILREGAFAGVSPIPSEFAVFQPPVGVVVPGSAVTIRSLGWGRLSINQGVPASCSAQGCAVNSFQRPDDPGTTESQCNENSCEEHSCGALGCVNNTCTDQICGTLDCQTNSQAPGVIDDLQAEASHPFVREIMHFFGTADLGEVAEEVMAYAAFGAVDTSLLPK